VVRAGNCSAKCSRNNSKSIAVAGRSIWIRQADSRRVQSLDDVAKTRAVERALYRLFPGVNDVRIARERCLLHCMSPFMARNRHAGGGPTNVRFHADCRRLLTLKPHDENSNSTNASNGPGQFHPRWLAVPASGTFGRRSTLNYRTETASAGDDRGCRLENVPGRPGTGIECARAKVVPPLINFVPRVVRYRSDGRRYSCSTCLSSTSPATSLASFRMPSMAGQSTPWLQRRAS
jgi:hypothetical protein